MISAMRAPYSLGSLKNKYGPLALAPSTVRNLPFVSKSNSAVPLSYPSESADPIPLVIIKNKPWTACFHQKLGALFPLDVLKDELLGLDRADSPGLYLTRLYLTHEENGTTQKNGKRSRLFEAAVFSFQSLYSSHKVLLLV